MASYNGTLVDGPHRAEDTLRCSTSIAAMDVDNPTLYEPIASVVPLAQPTYTRNSPVEELEQVHAGAKVDSFLDDYYYRIHIDPAEFALGAILNPLEEEFIVWNAWFVTKTASVISEVNPEEFDITGLPAPFSLAPLQWTTYTLAVPMEGSLEFTASITFVFPDESVVLEITGTRVLVFPWEPRTPLTERLGWNTSITRSKDGSEQRMMLRHAPRQMFDLDVQFSTEQLQARFDTALHGWQKRAWGLPVWPELTSHDATILTGDTAIYLDTSCADYRDDSTAVIWKSPTSYEAVKIGTVEADRLNLDVPVRSDWTGRKWIMPLRVAVMYAAVQRLSSPGGRGRARCNFVVSDNVVLSGYVSPATYQGLPVITKSTLVNVEQESESDADAFFVDYGLDDFQPYSGSDFNIVVQGHIFRRYTRAECWDFRKFLHSLHGRRDPFWVISDKKDMSLSGIIGAASTDFNIENIGFADNMGLNDMRTHLAFMFPDGTQLYREITGVAETDAATEVVSIDNSLGVEVHVGDCEICFLDKCRLTEDVTEFTWESLSRLRCNTNVTRVKA